MSVGQSGQQRRCRRNRGSWFELQDGEIAHPPELRLRGSQAVDGVKKVEIERRLDFPQRDIALRVLLPDGAVVKGVAFLEIHKDDVLDSQAAQVTFRFFG